MKALIGLFCLLIIGVKAYPQSKEKLCFAAGTPLFMDEWNKENFQRGVYYEFQFRSLEVLTKDISILLDSLGINSDFFIDDFVNQQCSRNRTSIGQIKLKSWMKISTNRNYSSFNDQEIKNVLYLKLKAIQLMCSWAGNLYLTDNFAPFFSDASVLSWFIQEVEKSKKTMECDGMFCRMGKKKLSGASVGGGFYYNDVKNEICRHQETHERSSKKLTKEHNFNFSLLADQLIFDGKNETNSLVKLGRKKDIYSWGWDNLYKQRSLEIDKSLQKLSENLLYETTPKLSLIKSSYWYDKNYLDLKLSFGDYDQSLDFLDKLRLDFTLKFSASVFPWVHRELKNYQHLKEEDQLDDFRRKIGLMIAPQIKSLKKTLFFEIDLEKTLIDSIIEKVLSKTSKTPHLNDQGLWIIPVHLHYGLFALKYLQEQRYNKHALKRAKLID